MTSLTDCCHHLSTLQSQKPRPHSRFFFCFHITTSSLYQVLLALPTQQLSNVSARPYLSTCFTAALMELVQQSPNWSSCLPAHLHPTPNPFNQTTSFYFIKPFNGSISTHARNPSIIWPLLTSSGSSPPHFSPSSCQVPGQGQTSVMGP